MSTLVGCVATVHAPFITGAPGLAPAERGARVMEGFARLRQWLEQTAPDLLVAFSNEHITNFLPENVPAFCVSIADANPAIGEFNLPEALISGDSAFAKGLVEFAYSSGFDLSYSSEFSLDHGTGLPLHFLTPGYEVPVVVILQNAIWSPMPTAQRAFEVGRLVRRYLDEEGSDRRVVCLGTGGISHWVGNRRHGDVNQAFDKWFLGRIRSGNYEELARLTQSEIDEAGDGANEIKNWVAVCGAAEGLVPEVVLDETFIPGWNTSAYQVTWSPA